MDPKLIVTLGRFAFGRYSPGEGITRARGQIREKDGRKIFPVLHPAAALRRNELRSTMLEDFKSISKILKGEAKEIEIETAVTVSDPLNAPQLLQLSFMDISGPAAGHSEQPETSTVNLEKAEQLTLF